MQLTLSETYLSNKTEKEWLRTETEIHHSQIRILFRGGDVNAYLLDHMGLDCEFRIRTINVRAGTEP